MANLVDKLIPRVDLIRQRAADKFGLPAHDVFLVTRTWDGGAVGSGTATVAEVAILPTPKVVFAGKSELMSIGLVDERTMTMIGVSLTYQENFLQGEPRALGVEIYYKLVERNGQGADTTYWILTKVPEVERSKIGWKLEFRRYTICS